MINSNHLLHDGANDSIESIHPPCTIFPFPLISPFRRLLCEEFGYKKAFPTPEVVQRAGLG